MKNRTWLIDIDGVILHHHGEGAAYQWRPGNEKIIDATLAQLNELEKRGDMIVLVTARPEHLRGLLEHVLHEAGAVWHKLVMGLTSGQRVLVNDNKGEGTSCFALDIRRNDGLLEEHLEYVDDWEEGESGTNHCWAEPQHPPFQRLVDAVHGFTRVDLPCGCQIRIDTVSNEIRGGDYCEEHDVDNKIGERDFLHQLARMVLEKTR